MEIKDPMSYGWANFNRLVKDYENMKTKEELIEERSHVEASFEGIANPDSYLYVEDEVDRQEKAKFVEGYIDALNWVLNQEN